MADTDSRWVETSRTVLDIEHRMTAALRARPDRTAEVYWPIGRDDDGRDFPLDRHLDCRRYSKCPCVWGERRGVLVAFAGTLEMGVVKGVPTLRSVLRFVKGGHSTEEVQVVDVWDRVLDDFLRGVRLCFWHFPPDPPRLREIYLVPLPRCDECTLRERRIRCTCGLGHWQPDEIVMLPDYPSADERSFP